MSSFVLWILLLGLWNVVLFYGNYLGVSVILYIIPLLIFMYLFLNKNNKIENKKGLLFMIPIILLSINYLLFNSELFDNLNVLAISCLFILMYIYTINPIYKVKEIFKNIISLMFKPFGYIGRFYRVCTSKLSGKLKISNNTKKVIKMLLIVVPVTLVIICLLSSADMIFGNFFNKVFDHIFDFIKNIFFDELFGKILSFIMISFAIGCTCMFILFEYKKEDAKETKEVKTRDLFTMKVLVSVLNLIYIVFDFIQIKSLLLHRVTPGINYAEYARQGFFELMVVSIINLAIILISKKFESKNNENEFKYIKVMNIIMVLLTLIIIVSSFLRMHMYEVAYGYTVLRLLVFVTLITEAILMIPTIMYIFNSEVNIVKSYMIILICAYVVTNFMNIDYMIARKNVNRYYSNNKLDVEYLENYYYGNIPVLVELYNKTDDLKIKDELSKYFESMKDDNTDSIFEFNLAKYKAHKLLDKVELINSIRDYSDFE